MFIEQAYKGNNAWWRVVVTIIITTGILISSLAMYFILTPEELQAQYDMMKHLPSIVALALNLLPFVFLLAFIFICVYLIIISFAFICEKEFQKAEQELHKPQE